MNIAIRVDASEKIGTGHLVRGLTLANAAKAKGASVRFLASQMPENLVSTIRERGHEISIIDVSRSDKPENSIANTESRGTSQDADAQQSLHALSGQTWDWVIVDHYTLDYRWEIALRTAARQIMVIDDLADRKHSCDLLLDQNEFQNKELRYADFVEGGCRVMLGARYTLLNPVYSTLHKNLRPKSSVISRILIYFGGADHFGLTAKALNALSRITRRDISIDVGLPMLSDRLDDIQNAAQSFENIRLHRFLPSLAPLMLEADLAIGAGGTTTWERFCLRLPALVVTLADNQHELSRQLDERGFITWLGRAENVSEADIEEALSGIVSGRTPLRIPPPDLVDGLGAERVVEIMNSF